MGIYSRDYLREDRRGWSAGGFWGTPGCKWIIVATVVVFVLQLVSTRGMQIVIGDQVFSRHVSPVTQALELDTTDVMHGQVWRLLTYAFCHDVDIWHIAINMIVLWWAGTTLERMYGTREFVLFYLVAACVSGLAFLALAMITSGPSVAIGASGAVMAAFAVYAILFPRQEIYVFFVVPVQIRFLLLFYVVYDLFPVLNSLSGHEGHDRVAHAAHLGGLAFGFAYHRFGWRIERLTANVPSLLKKQAWVRPRHVKVYRPPEEAPQNFDGKVDAILDKIHSQGEASLTEQERETLRKASERYKSQRHS
jgi:membrane associated rhomboid family serine protease